MADKKLTVTVISPDKEIFSGVADTVTVPGINGSMGILFNHAPLISELDVGIVTITDDNENIAIAVDGGFVEIRNNNINILANGGDLKKNLKLETAQMMLDDAESLKPSERKQKELKKARARLAVLNS